MGFSLPWYLLVLGGVFLCRKLEGCLCKIGAQARWQAGMMGDATKLGGVYKLVWFSVSLKKKIQNFTAIEGKWQNFAYLLKEKKKKKVKKK